MDNPNTLNMSEVWNKSYQINHDKIPVYPAISNYRLAAGLKKGDTVHRQYSGTLVANDMDGDGGYTPQAFTDTDETLVINKEYEASVYIKDLDALQADLPLQDQYAKRAMVALFNKIDGDILGLYDQFNQTLDDGDLGGTSGNGITPTTNNAKKIFFTAKRLLQKQNIMLDNGAQFTGFKSEDDKNAMAVAVISPELYQFLLEAVDGKDTVFGDTVAQSGHAGRFAGFNLFISNALGYSAVLSMVAQPTDGDTVTVNGVTFTFKTTLGTTAGNVLIGGSADAARANLAAAIANTEGTAASTVSALSKYVELSAANRLLIPKNRVTTTNDNTADTMALKLTGSGSVAVSETFTDATDTWTAAKQVQHALFGVANSIDVVIQKEPSMTLKDVYRKVGKDVVTWTACGYKVFNDGKAQMIDAWLRTDAY